MSGPLFGMLANTAMPSAGATYPVNLATAYPNASLPADPTQITQAVLPSGAVVITSSTKPNMDNHYEIVYDRYNATSSPIYSQNGNGAIVGYTFYQSFEVDGMSPAQIAAANLVQINQITSICNQLLLACDYTQLPDTLLTTPKLKQAWANYRATIRALPTANSTVNAPYNVAWPIDPNGLSGKPLHDAFIASIGDTAPVTTTTTTTYANAVITYTDAILLDSANGALLPAGVVYSLVPAISQSSYVAELASNVTNAVTTILNPTSLNL